MDYTLGDGNWITVITERSIWTHFDGFWAKLLLKTFNNYLIYVIYKNVKSSFLNLKKRKIRILEHCPELEDSQTPEVTQNVARTAKSTFQFVRAAVGEIHSQTVTTKTKKKPNTTFLHTRFKPQFYDRREPQIYRENREKTVLTAIST